MSSPEQPIAKTYSCDVLVIGSGVSGYCAAIQAGRCGCRTILVEKDDVLGGNSGPNLGVGITGADRYNCYATESGLIHELQEDAAWACAYTPVCKGSAPYSISRRNEAVVQEHLERAGVTVLKRHYARAPIVGADGAIGAVVLQDLASFQTVRVEVQHVVVEASGDGEIGYLAGADYDYGSESRAEFGERSAPVARNREVQGTSLVAIAIKTDHEVAFVPPAGTLPYRPRGWHGRVGAWIHHHDGWFRGYEGIRFLYLTETGGLDDTIRDDCAIYERLLRQLWAEWEHIKNGPHADEARNWDILWVSPKAGKRESRRLLGDVVLAQTDLEAGRLFADDIAYGGHDLDDHKPLGEGGHIYGISIPPLYGIPYRACYSRNVPNLLIAGRLISATHLAHSSTRLMRTGGAIGQAVGLAAALCCRHGCAPREIYTAHLDELQRELLLADGTILARSVPPAGDLARSATVSATSEVRYNDQDPGEFVPLLCPTGVVLWDWAPTLERLELYLRNTSDRPQPLTLSLHRAKREPRWKTTDEFEECARDDLRDQAFELLGEVLAVLPARHEGWFEVVLPQPLYIGIKDACSDDDRLIISLGQNAEVEWALIERHIASSVDTALRTSHNAPVARAGRTHTPPWEIAEMVEHSHFSPTWRLLGAMVTLRLTPAPPLGEATNVTDGYHRRFTTGPTHMWMSDPDQTLPQELVLTWPEAQRFDRVTLTFDNLTRLRHENPWEGGIRALPRLIKAYALDCWDGTEWRTLVEERNNIHRFLRHSFTAVSTTRLRLRVLATHDGESRGARVYQIRVESAV